MTVSKISRVVSSGALVALFVSGLTLSLPSVAETAAEKGRAIAEEGDRRNQGWEDGEVQAVMILRNKQGEESVRQMRVRSLEIQNDGDMGIVVFDEPKDVAGTALLTHAHEVGNDDQWLYLPALKRVKRIASGNRSGPFMGSEFSYEDLSSQTIDKYTYNYLRDEPCPAHPEQMCFVSERMPKDEDSGYTKQVAWVDQEEYRVWKVEYYDRKESLLKTMTIEDFDQYLGQYWRPTVVEMLNHQTGKSTTMKWSNYEFKVGFSDRDFDKDSLKNIE